MENFLATLAYLVIGVILARLSSFPKDGAATLNAYVIHVALPALILREVPKLRLATDLLLPAIIPWGLLAVCAVAVLGAARFWRWDDEITGALLLLACMGNTAFLGIPVTEAFFGRAAVPYAVIYDQLGSFLALSTFGALVVAVYGPPPVPPQDTDAPAPHLPSSPSKKPSPPVLQRAARPRPTEILWRIVRFPPFIALLLAASLLRAWSLPPVADAIVAALAGTLVPVVMIAVGMQLRPRLAPGTLLPFAAGLGIKLLLSPALALAAVFLLGRHDLAAQVSVLEAGMPPMVSAGAVAAAAGMAPRLVAALVGLGILASFVTLPLLRHILISLLA